MYNDYGHSNEIEYQSRLVKINFEEECKRDLETDNGFIITGAQGIKKALKDPDGIFSSRYGRGVDDISPNGDRHKCECGNLRSRSNEGILCPKCKTKVKFVDDNFAYTGWLVIQHGYKVIHPIMYKTIQSFIGQKAFNNMMNLDENFNSDGIEIPVETPDPDKEPFFRIGIYEFINRFDEIITFYKKMANTQSKQDAYEEIIKNRDLIFTSCIPVYTTLLRLLKTSGIQLEYYDINGNFNNMAMYTARINRNKLTLYKTSIPEYLQKLQDEFMNVYADIEEILSGKTGLIRRAYGGKYNFTARNVIKPDASLKVDQITLSYYTLCDLLQQKIINIIAHRRSISINDAYMIWSVGRLKENYELISIINSIINSYPFGIPVMINRNPTLEYGSMIQMHVIGICYNFTMGVPLDILPSLQADFDGDVLNVKLIINDKFYQTALLVYNPRRAMIINRNDGLLYVNYLPTKNTLVNLNNFINLGRDKYDPEYKRSLIEFYNKVNA
jgi:hypothetical protein